MLQSPMVAVHPYRPRRQVQLHRLAPTLQELDDRVDDLTRQLAGVETQKLKLHTSHPKAGQVQDFGDEPLHTFGALRDALQQLLA